MRATLQAIAGACYVQLYNTMRRPVFRFSALVQPLIFVTIAHFMLRHSGQTSTAVFVLIGSGIAGLWSSILFSSAGEIERERIMGTLEGMFLTPTDFKVIMFGKVLANGLLGLLPLVLSLVYGYVLYGVRLTTYHPGVLVLGFVLLCSSCMVMAMTLAPLFALSRSSNALMNGLEYPLIVLSGVLFPAELLPIPLKWISYLLAPTWAMRILRMSFTPTLSLPDLQFYVAALLGITLAYAIAMRFLYQTMERQVRITGSMGVE